MSRLLYLAELLRLGWPRRSGRLRSRPILPQRGGRDVRSAGAVVVEPTKLAACDKSDQHMVVRGAGGSCEPMRPTCPTQVPGVLHAEAAGGVNEHVLPLLSTASPSTQHRGKEKPSRRRGEARHTAGAGAEPPYGIEP